MSDCTGIARILGVHPVSGYEEVWLIEIDIIRTKEFDWSNVTQEDINQPKPNWQTAWDEQAVESFDKANRFAFFFHDLQFDRPLVTSVGSINLVAPTPIPDHLAQIVYEAP